MHRTRVKVCGMTRPDQASALVDLGVDAIGLIFYEKSPRNVSVLQAQEIRKIVPAFVTLVGVFVNQSASEINQICQQVRLNLVQLHGDQSANFANDLTYSYIKAIRVDSKERIVSEINQHNNAVGFLLDTYSKNAYGGTGHKIDESFLPKSLPRNIILAGGINPSNIDKILEKKPYAIDINSGVEHAPGDKNLEAIADIMDRIKPLN